MRKAIIYLIFTLGCVYFASGGEIDYTKGIFIVNEDWYGHQNSTVNYLLPDDPEENYWHYRIIQTENPGVELGCTNQYGAIWNGRFYLIAKQDKDPGAAIRGGRISVVDATTMKVIKQLPAIDPSGAQCDGRAFCGVSPEKGYVSTSNGIWVLDLTTLEIERQVEGTKNPNAGGDNDKPNSDPTGALYKGQCGTMILAAGKVFAVHQQYGMLVIDPVTDKVVKILDMTIIDDAIEHDTGNRPAVTAGIGSTLVRAKDGSIWYNVAKNVKGTGTALPYIVRLDPETLEREVVRIEGDDIYPPSNSWYAWTPDPFCASFVTNRLYWCGGSGRFAKRSSIFRFDTDTRKVEKITDLDNAGEGWHIYGCSLGIHPDTDELYASLYHEFSDPTYTLQRFDADGKLIRNYPMISNYWFPSLPVFPTNPYNDPENANITEVEKDTDITIRVEGSSIIVEGCDNPGIYSIEGFKCRPTNLSPGLYIVKAGQTTKKVIISD